MLEAAAAAATARTEWVAASWETFIVSVDDSRVLSGVVAVTTIPVASQSRSSSSSRGVHAPSPSAFKSDFSSHFNQDLLQIVRRRDPRIQRQENLTVFDLWCTEADPFFVLNCLNLFSLLGTCLRPTAQSGTAAAQTRPPPRASNE